MKWSATPDFCSKKLAQYPEQGHLPQGRLNETTPLRPFPAPILRNPFGGGRCQTVGQLCTFDGASSLHPFLAARSRLYKQQLGVSSSVKFMFA